MTFHVWDVTITPLRLRDSLGKIILWRTTAPKSIASGGRSCAAHAAAHRKCNRAAPQQFCRCCGLAWTCEARLVAPVSHGAR